ncbi:MAG: hypothetical protein R6W67_07880 [Bacteroidales bacterium]
MRNPDYIGKLFRQQSENIPSVVTGKLHVNFAGATRIEWTLQGEVYEAIFYHENVEKIARFNTAGQLIEYRINIAPDNIPAIVKDTIPKDLEIMNCISVCISGQTTYELIVRNRELVRYQMGIDSKGNQLNLKTL